MIKEIRRCKFCRRILAKKNKTDLCYFHSTKTKETKKLHSPDKTNHPVGELRHPSLCIRSVLADNMR